MKDERIFNIEDEPSIEDRISISMRDLDFVLCKLNNKNIEYPIPFKNIFKLNSKLSQYEKTVCLNKLVEDGFIEVRYPKVLNVKTGIKEEVLNDPYYNITYQGLDFINKAWIYKKRPYKTKRINEGAKTIWAIVKTLSVIASTLLIIFVAWLSYLEAKRSNELNIKSQEQKEIIFKQQNAIDSLSKDQKAYDEEGPLKN